MSGDALERLQQRLGYRFADERLLRCALREAVQVPGWDHQRLEFIGDSLLGCAAALALAREFPDWDEGDLTRGLSQLVRGSSLAALAREMQLEPLVHTAPGTPRPSDAALEDVTESLVGAVWADSNWEEAQRVALALFARQLAEMPAAGVDKPVKNRLQEWAQERGLALPDYRCEQLVNEPDRTLWRARCEMAGERTSAEARSKMQAESAAALAMLRKLEASA